MQEQDNATKVYEALQEVHRTASDVYDDRLDYTSSELAEVILSITNPFFGAAAFAHVNNDELLAEARRRGIVP